MEENRRRKRKRRECSREYVNMRLTQNIVLVDVINAGSFGDIYLGRDSITGKEYAVKFDKNETPRTQKNFMKEYNIMKDIEGKGNFPKCTVALGSQNKIGKTALIMDKLGPNIYQLFKICGRRLTVGSVTLLIQQMIKRLEELHNCGIIHRDIKPENFCLGGRDLKQVYLIDFGLSRGYREDDYTHKPLIKNRGFVGTPRYASKNAHQGLTQSRRDDLEAVGYMCVFLMKGSLPWQNVKIKDKKLKHHFLHQKKSSINIGVLCEDLPVEFKLYLEEVRNLKYDQTPQYNKLIRMFKDSQLERNLSSRFCWESQADFVLIRDKYLESIAYDLTLAKNSGHGMMTDRESDKRSMDNLDEEIYDEPLPKYKMQCLRRTPGMLLESSNGVEKAKPGFKGINTRFAEDDNNLGGIPARHRNF